MSRRVGVWLVVAVALVLAYPGAAWLIGLAAERGWQTRQQQLLQKQPYVEVLKRDFHRGVYTSTEDVTYRFSGRLHALTTLSNTQFEVRNIIHHGPLPQLRSFAPATVDTEIILPPRIRDDLARIFGTGPTFTIHTRMHWLGGSTTTVHSPAFESQGSNGISWSSQGLDGSGEVSSDLQHSSGDFRAPRLTVKSGAGELSLDSLRLATDQFAALGPLYTGTFNLTLARATVSQAGGKVDVRNVTIAATTMPQGDYIDMDINSTADALQSDKFAVTRLGYELRFSHFHASSLSKLLTALQAMQGMAPNSAAYKNKLKQALKTDGVEILLHDPAIEIPHIGFSTPEGQMSVSLKVTVPGLSRADFDSDPAALQVPLVRHVQASADLHIDTDLLDKLLDSTGKGDLMAARLQGLQQQGYLKLDGKTLSSHLSYQGGQLTVNDHAFPAVGPMPQPPAPLPPGGHPPH